MVVRSSRSLLDLPDLATGDIELLGWQEFSDGHCFEWKNTEILEASLCGCAIGNGQSLRFLGAGAMRLTSRSQRDVGVINSGCHMLLKQVVLLKLSWLGVPIIEVERHHQHHRCRGK